MVRRTINAVTPTATTVVQNSGGLSIIEVVERGPQGIPGTVANAAVQFWDATTAYTLNEKVSYLDGIYNALGDVPVGTLPTDEIYWGTISGSGESVIPVRGGDVPADYDPAINYALDARVSINDFEYICIEATTGVFDPTKWMEVSTQNNELRIAALETAGGTGTVYNEYTFTETTTSVWSVSNAGATQADFDSAKIEFFYNGVKLRKGTEVVWVSDVTIQIPLTSVQNEDYLDIRVATTASVSFDPTEVEFTQNVPANGIWSVTGIGDTLTDFNNAKLSVFYNGVKMRKGTQAVWVSPNQLQISYTSVSTEDYLTIRNEQ